jgi:hypothetical protein
MSLAALQIWRGATAVSRRDAALDRADDVKVREF